MLHTTEDAVSCRAPPTERHSLPVAPNLSEQRFALTRPDQVWTADITYVPTREGWLYVAALKDLFAGEIVGRSFGERMTTDLIVRALQQAVATRRPAAGLIHHSDRGSQYCSTEYRGLLDSHGLRASMSRRGNCYDNRAGRELPGHVENRACTSSSLRDTRRSRSLTSSEYIDIFYNRQRRQARLGYVSPAAFTRQFLRQQQRAA